MHTKLIQFTLLININKRQREFNFRQRTNEWFDVNTADERGERYYFKIVKEEDQWKIADQLLPAWLRENEKQIIEALLKSDSDQPVRQK